MSEMLMGLTAVLTPYNLLICLVGLFVGVLFGALPGFSATMAVAIFVPFTYSMEPGSALLLLSGLYCGGVYGGSIPAVLLGIPGTPASAPTALEGNALVRKGEAGKALHLVTLASVFGGFLSAMCLLVFSGLLAKVAMMVGQPEQMFITIFGLSVVIMLSEDNLYKGVMVAIVSLILACFGQDPIEGYPRFTYGFSQMVSGLNVTAVLIGLFSLPEVFKMLEDPFGKIAESGKVGSMKLKFSLIKKSMINALRSTAIGVGIGIVPAAGPDIAAFMAYNQAKKASKEPEKFGTGSDEGIVAAEAGNNGATGGSLIPLLTLGIPGSAPAALFLSAMILHGVRPGPTLFTEHAETVYTMIIGFAVINLLMYFVGMFYCKAGSMILKIPKAILATSIVVLAVVGTFATNKNMFDVWVMFASGVIGYIMIRNDFPIAPIALSLLLGSNMEKAWSVTKTLYEGELYMIFTRPLAAILALLTIASFAFPIIKMWRKRKAAATKTEAK